MAVPKKRTSKSKKNLRKTVWKKKAEKQVLNAYSMIQKVAKSLNVENVSSTISSSQGIGFGKNRK